MRRDVVNRWLTLRTHKVRALPIAILMPHASCDCRCVMCDIWKARGDAERLTEEDVTGLVDNLVELRTRWVVLSGGEPLLHDNLFGLCRMLRGAGIARITLLSSGQRLEACAPQIAEHMDEVVVSLDGTRPIHDAIRRVPGAYDNVARGVAAVKKLAPSTSVTARCVIQRRNFTQWSEIVSAAREIGCDGISFLAADLTSQAFNRASVWTE